ncbi:hypothetical protein lerEdw1_017388 [Lerista edwardsae]|nr:hypothetical protein lerEdw1_017388 [Lerista edwardsae]
MNRSRKLFSRLGAERRGMESNAALPCPALPCPARANPCFPLLALGLILLWAKRFRGQQPQRHSSLGWTNAIKEPKIRQNGKLHVIGAKDAVVIEPIQTLPRRNVLTKIVKNDNLETSVRLPDCIEKKADEKEKKSLNIEKASSSEVWTEAKVESLDKENAGDDKSSDSSDDDDSEQGNDVQKQIAPLELMGEFLKAIMEQKYSLAKKLCQMILIYEPENPEAKQFLPLIEHKLLLESEQPDDEEEDDDEETDEESSDDSEEDTSSTDNNETDSEASSKDSDDNED